MHRGAAGMLDARAVAQQGAVQPRGQVARHQRQVESANLGGVAKDAGVVGHAQDPW